jgi:hypothetical protein
MLGAKSLVKLGRYYQLVEGAEMRPLEQIAMIFNRAVIWLMNAAFGRARYRVKFIYKDGGRVVFDITQTVTIYKPEQIDRGREMKIAFGNLAKEMPEIKPYLCNGTLLVEPTCYLGRWKDV